DNPEEFDNIVEEDEQEVLVKPDKNSRSFKKLFFSFWKNRDEKQKDHESLIEVLSEDAEISNKEINSGSIKSKDKKSEGTDNNEEDSRKNADTKDTARADLANKASEDRKDEEA